MLNNSQELIAERKVFVARANIFLAQSNFLPNFRFKSTGRSETIAKMQRMIILFQEKASLEEVNLFKVCPACIATKEGGATPKNVPTIKGINGTPMTGLAKLINQFGKSGVILRNNM